MAFADATETGYASCPEGAGDLEPLAALFCERAIAALEDAVRAISDDDVPARCDAVSRATEAATSLFLELETSCAAGPQDTGQLYETLLTHLVHVNLRNDTRAAAAALGLLQHLRGACAQTMSPRPLALAARL